MRSHPAFAVAFALGLAAACGPNTAQIARAQHAIYQGDPAAMLTAAEQATESSHYPIDQTDADTHAFATANRIYSAEGVSENEGSGGAVQMTDRSIVLQFVVRIVPADSGFTVEIEPHVQRAYIDRSNTDELAADDPSMPGWVHSRTDELAVAIHDALAGYEVKTPPAP